MSVQLAVCFSLVAASVEKPTLAVDAYQIHNYMPITQNLPSAAGEVDMTDESETKTTKKREKNSVNFTNSTTIETMDTTPPIVESKNPEDGARRISIDATVDVTFNESMDASTINTDSFKIESGLGDAVVGTVSYDSSSQRATFVPDEELNFGEVYTTTLTSAIQDEAGNSLETTSWSFTTGGRIRIGLQDVQTGDLLADSAFTITPDPFTLQGSLIVEDNGIYDSQSTDGIIFIDNVVNNFTTYIISETTVPNGYSRIYGDSIVTAVQRDACSNCPVVSSLQLQNLHESVHITEVEDLILVARPFLNKTQFELYNDRVVVGVFSGVQGNLVSTTVTIRGPDSGSLPDGFLATNNTLHLAPVTESFNFEMAASPTLTGAEIIDLFDVPTYPGPIENLAPFITYSVPALVIPYEGSANNFILTPVIDKIYPGLTLLLNQSSFVETKVASVRQLSMTFDTEGTLVGFSFGVSDTPPAGTPEPPLDVPALFLDVGFVGDVDFSNPLVFQSSPIVDVVVNKTIEGFDQLEDGCADFHMLVFNEDSGEWEIIEKLRNPKFDTESQCGFSLAPPHFSKFAVGGVKGQSVPTEDPPGPIEEDSERRRGGGGGGSRSTGITNTPSGNDVQTTITTSSGSITLEFDSVEAGSGQLKVETNRMTAFEDILEVVHMAVDNDEHGMARIAGATYSTVGEVYNVDASDVTFSGMVDVTIPYDERTARLLSSGLESEVRFLHYDENEGAWEDNTLSVDETANTVTGRLDSLSPVAAAVILETKDTADPWKQLEVTNLALDNSDGKVTLSASLHSIRQVPTDYVLVIQFLDQDNVVQHIEWQQGSLSASASDDITISWDHLEDTFRVNVFLWTELENPSILAATVQTTM
ncbi:MAG: Ig-like domain-containing protein [Nitrososphaera sp.]|nr:Ig-like domain-containing protein [Nitrososphaera sp.]